MPVIPGLEDRIGNYHGWLTLSDFPEADGSVLRIAEREFPFDYICMYSANPKDFRPCVAIDITDLDVPIELLEGETVEFG